jgi:hypothetical protein
LFLWRSWGRGVLHWQKARRLIFVRAARRRGNERRAWDAKKRQGAQAEAAFELCVPALPLSRPAGNTPPTHPCASAAPRGAAPPPHTRPPPARLRCGAIKPGVPRQPKALINLQSSRQAAAKAMPWRARWRPMTDQPGRSRTSGKALWSNSVEGRSQGQTSGAPRRQPNLYRATANSSGAPRRQPNLYRATANSSRVEVKAR